MSHSLTQDQMLDAYETVGKFLKNSGTGTNVLVFPRDKADIIEGGDVPKLSFMAPGAPHSGNFSKSESNELKYSNAEIAKDFVEKAGITGSKIIIREVGADEYKEKVVELHVPITEHNLPIIAALKKAQTAEQEVVGSGQRKVATPMYGLGAEANATVTAK